MPNCGGAILEKYVREIAAFCTMDEKEKSLFALQVMEAAATAADNQISRAYQNPL